MCCTRPAYFNYIRAENCMNKVSVCHAQIIGYAFILTVRNDYFMTVLSSYTFE